ncbi:motile sperm domain-containing protein 1-like [Aplochiton taeniatus]
MQGQPIKRQDSEGSGRSGSEGRRRQRETGETGETTPPSPLPVFLFPTELLFYAAQRSSHRRVLTLYNPYSFNLSFKMLCTAPSLYRVVDAEGSVRAKSCVDLVVRHQEVSLRHCGRRDCFRLEVSGGGQRGSREVWAELKPGEEGGGGENVALLPSRTPGLQDRNTVQTQPGFLQFPGYTAMQSPSQFAVCVVLGVACVTVLMFPLHSEPSSMVPSYAHVTVNHKLVCAYILGLLTMAFLR